MTPKIPDWSQNMYGEPIPIEEYGELASDNRDRRLRELADIPLSAVEKRERMHELSAEVQALAAGAALEGAETTIERGEE